MISGDSKILLVDGSYKRVDEISGEEYGWSIDNDRVFPVTIKNVKKVGKCFVDHLKVNPYYDDGDLVVGLDTGIISRNGLVNDYTQKMYSCRVNPRNDMILCHKTKIYVPKETLIRNEYDLFEEEYYEIKDKELVLNDLLFIRSMCNNDYAMIVRATMDRYFLGMIGVDKLSFKQVLEIMKIVDYKMDDVVLDVNDYLFLDHLKELTDIEKLDEELDKKLFCEFYGEYNIEKLNLICNKLGYSNIGHIISSSGLHETIIESVEKKELDCYEIELDHGSNIGCADMFVGI